jgi:DNA-binding beta-propeller fold protein YncE
MGALGWLAIAAGIAGQATSGDALRAAGVIPMPSVNGRIDHLSVDLTGKRLFVAALGNNTLEVLDVAAMRVLRSISGLHEPQGIRFLPDRNRIAVANGGDGATIFYEGSTLAALHTTKLSGDADNVRYDQKARRVYVGYAGGALAVLDPDGKPLGDIKLAGHPESFQLETGGPRIFVNVPDANQIAVVDREKQAVTAKWPVTSAGANYPMALDEANHRLFVGCRRPAKLLVYDTTAARSSPRSMSSATRTICSMTPPASACTSSAARATSRCSSSRTPTAIGRFRSSRRRRARARVSTCRSSASCLSPCPTAARNRRRFAYTMQDRSSRITAHDAPLDRL